MVYTTAVYFAAPAILLYQFVSIHGVSGRNFPGFFPGIFFYLFHLSQEGIAGSWLFVEAGASRKH